MTWLPASGAPWKRRCRLSANACCMPPGRPSRTCAATSTLPCSRNSHCSGRWREGILLKASSGSGMLATVSAKVKVANSVCSSHFRRKRPKSWLKYFPPAPGAATPKWPHSSASNSCCSCSPTMAKWVSRVGASSFRKGREWISAAKGTRCVWFRLENTILMWLGSVMAESKY